MKRLLQIASILFLAILIVGLVEAQFHLLHNLFRGRPLRQRELATEWLGAYLAAHYPGKGIIVLSNPFSQKPGQPSEIYQFEKAGLHGLQQGLGTAIKIEGVVFPELKPEFFTNRRAIHIDPHTTTPLTYLVADDSLDKLATQYPAAEIIVSLIGLPVNVRQTQAWKAENRKFALLLPDLRMIGDQTAIRQAIQSQKIAAMVLNKPGAPPEDQPLGKDLKMEFDQRFLLVTSESVDRYLRAYPRLF